MKLPTVTTSGTFNAAQTGDHLTFSDGSTAVVVSVKSNTFTIRYNWWTRFKRWCYEKWNWRKLRDQDAALHRRYFGSTTNTGVDHG
jgi:hypothetical protein